MIGIVYFGVIFLACILGAIVGLGGGVFIRPIFDAIGAHSVLNISFFSSTAIVTMAIVSTLKKLKDGLGLKADLAILISSGAVVGGFLGIFILGQLVARFDSEDNVQVVMAAVTTIIIICAIIATLKSNVRFELKSKVALPFIGVILGTISSFLGIGGGPINVPLFMILFGFPIKKATAYSIIIIFFSHSSKLISMGIQENLTEFNLWLLPFIITAAGLGGFIGANLSKVFSESTVKKLFIAALSVVVVLNIVNGINFLSN